MPGLDSPPAAHRRRIEAPPARDDLASEGKRARCCVVVFTCHAYHTFTAHMIRHPAVELPSSFQHESQ